MIANLPPYLAYKPSSLDWLGDIPAHWEVVALKRMGQFTSGAGFPVEEQGRLNQDLPFFKVSDMNLPGNDKIMSTGNNSVSHETAVKLGATIFPPDTIIFPKVGGALLTNKRRVIERPSCIDNNLMGCIVHRGAPHFVLLLLKNLDLGTIAKPGPVPAISEGEVREIRTVFPPLPEQHAIARYLDHVDRRIQRYIDTKEKLIALLQERRKVATEEALQSSGTANQRLKAVVELVERSVKRTSGESYTPIGLYNRGRGIFLKEPRRGDELGDSDFFWIEEGDLVISGQFAWEGAIALAGDVEHGCIASHRFPLLRGKSGISDSGFLLSFFQTDWGQLILDHHSRGAAGRNRPLNVRTLMKEKISLPPIGEQVRIAEMLQLEFRFRNYVRHSVQLLNEYRASLIAHVVTGKLDVRAAAEQIDMETSHQ